MGVALSAQTSKSNERASWAPILLKVIFKSIKVRFTCKKLSPYFKYLLRFWDWRVLLLWDIVSTWPTKMLVTRSILELKMSNFGLKGRIKKKAHKLGLLAQPPLIPTYLQNLGLLNRCNADFVLLYFISRAYALFI